MKRRQFLAFLGAAIASLMVALSLNLLVQSPSQAKSTVLVSAAASLKDSLSAIKPVFEKTNTSIAISYNFASSGALQRQIEQGAPADIFISAAAKQMDALQAKGLVLNDTRRVLATNRLVVIVPTNSKLNLTNFNQLAGSRVRRISVGEFRSVPAGQYAEEVFKKLGVLNAVKSKLIFANSVRGVLATVESGNVDAGIVYVTDAKTSRRVRVAAIAPENLHSPIVYPIAVLRNSSNRQAAKTYTQFLTSNSAKRIFQQFGFGMP